MSNSSNNSNFPLLSQSHMSGVGSSKRPTAASAAAVTSTLAPAEPPVQLPNTPDIDSYELFCKPCQQYFATAASLKDHLDGRRHRLVVGERIDAPAVPDIPIFTKEFLEYNQTREQEMRDLRRAATQYEDQARRLTQSKAKLEETLQALAHDGSRLVAENSVLLGQLTTMESTVMDVVSEATSTRAHSAEDAMQRLEALARNRANHPMIQATVLQIMDTLAHRAQTVPTTLSTSTVLPPQASAAAAVGSTASGSAGNTGTTGTTGAVSAALPSNPPTPTPISAPTSTHTAISFTQAVPHTAMGMFPANVALYHTGNTAPGFMYAQQPLGPMLPFSMVSLAGLPGTGALSALDAHTLAAAAHAASSATLAHSQQAMDGLPALHPLPTHATVNPTVAISTVMESSVGGVNTET